MDQCCIIQLSKRQCVSLSAQGCWDPALQPCAASNVLPDMANMQSVSRPSSVCHY